MFENKANYRPLKFNNSTVHSFARAPFTPCTWAALYADFNLMREEGGFGQSERRLVFHSLCLVSLWSRPASLPDYRSLLYSTYCVCCNHFLSYISGSNDPQHRSCSVDPISKRCWLYFRSWSLLPLWSVCTDGDRVSACSAGAQTVPYSEIYVGTGVREVRVLQFCTQRLAFQYWTVS